MKRLILFILAILSPLILAFTFIAIGSPDENGRISLTGEATSTPDGYQDLIDDSKEAIYESAAEALARISETDAPTDKETVEANDEPDGQGFHTTLEAILARRKADGDNDGGRGWQCSKYTAYLATGKKDYSSSHPDYGPVNGNKVAEWLVKNYGFKYIDTPVEGAIGSGGFNTTYGHTVMYLYGNTVNDANWSPLKVSTHTMNLSGYKWVVPASYEPSPTPTPDPQPSVTSYSVRKGDTLGGISLKMGWWPSTVGLYGDDGYAQRLAEKNNILNRGLIYPNQIINKVDE